MSNSIYAVKGFELTGFAVSDGPCEDYTQAKALALELLCDRSGDCHFLAWCRVRKLFWLKKVLGQDAPQKNGDIFLFFSGKDLGGSLVGVCGWDMPYGDVHESSGDFEQAQSYYYDAMAEGRLNSHSNLGFVAWCSARNMYWHKKIPGAAHPSVNSNVTLIFHGEYIFSKEEIMKSKEAKLEKATEKILPVNTQTDNYWIYYLTNNDDIKNVQNIEEGFDSFHIMANGGSYTDSTKIVSEDTYGFPPKSMFSPESFDHEKKEWRGVIDYEALGYPNCTFKKYVVLLKFSNDMQKITNCEQVWTVTANGVDHKEVEKAEDYPDGKVGWLLRSEKI